MLRQVGAAGGVLIAQAAVRKIVRVGLEIVRVHAHRQRLRRAARQHDGRGETH